MKISGTKILFTGLFLLALSGFAAYVVFMWEETMPRKDEQPLFFYNGIIITMDNSHDRVDALLTGNNRILFTGTQAEALPKVPENARRIDLQGKTLIPGFNDNHVHSLVTGYYQSQLDLAGKTCPEIAEMVRREVARKKPGELIEGKSWDYTTCAAPHREILDIAAPRNPVFLMQYSGHAAWVNSVKLAAMGINRNTPDPPGGQIVRDGKGEPTGILRDKAMRHSVASAIFRRIMDKKVHRHFIEKSLELYRSAGITSVQDNTWDPLTVRLLKKLDREHALTCRFSCWPQGDSYLYYPFRIFTSFNEDDMMVRRGPVKYFADGAFSSRSAWLNEPYADEPGNSGRSMHSSEELEEYVMTAAKNRRQIAVHAIGDRAVHQVLNAIEKAQQAYPWTRELRFRIEHLQLVEPDDILRMKKLGIVACLQPTALGNPEKDKELLGEARAKRAYPCKSLLKAGIPVSLGSDMPTESDYHPIMTIYYAVNRKDKSGKNGPLNKDEMISIEDALRCYTLGSAYAEFMEQEKGSITVGKLADFTVLSEDLTVTRSDKLKEIEVLMTIVGGRVVFEKEGIFNSPAAQTPASGQ